MLSSLSTGEMGEDGVLFLLLCFIGCHPAIDCMPSCSCDFLARNLEPDTPAMCGNDGCKEGAVLAEGADETLGDEVEDTAFPVSQAVRFPACGYDGVVVGDLRAVKDLAALPERVLYQPGKLSVLPRYASRGILDRCRH